MQNETLAVKYRPKSFENVCSQSAIIKILQKQIQTKTFKNSYIFAGASGCGKTTVARIMANLINNGVGSPIEVDAASNNSVENVREIGESANQRAVDGEYKIYIIDEAHSLSSSAWQAFLKLIEEPPKYTIFIFCTTELQKIPMTIMNRCQIHLFGKISNELINNRLKYICTNEGINCDAAAIDQITKMSQGSMRQAISYLDKCKDYSNNIDVKVVCECLGDLSYDTYFKLTNALIDNNCASVIEIIEDLNMTGVDFRTFINSYASFVLQLAKYTIFKSMQGIDIPEYLEENVKYTTAIVDAYKYYQSLSNRVLEIKQAIKGDTDIKTTISIMLLDFIKL